MPELWLGFWGCLWVGGLYWGWRDVFGVFMFGVLGMYRGSLVFVVLGCGVIGSSPNSDLGCTYSYF